MSSAALLDPISEDDYLAGERRTGFVREVHQSTAAVVPLAKFGCTYPLADVYENVGLET